MRQAGYMAATGIYALENKIRRLEADHAHAKKIAAALLKKEFVEHILPVETNIVIFGIKSPYTAAQISMKLKEKNILALPISPMQIRIVLHLGVTANMADYASDVIEKL